MGLDEEKALLGEEIVVVQVKIFFIYAICYIRFKICPELWYTKPFIRPLIVLNFQTRPAIRNIYDHKLM